jgi:poly-gamma-glutamate capsule biosynthesis protein CapA/YwtB (metallophosphatase superfamily)
MKLIASVVLFSLISFVNIFAQDTTKVSLLFAGDIMGHGSQITSARIGTSQQYDYNPCFQFIKPYLRSVDLAIGNLELTLAGPPYSGYPQFGSPDALAYTLKDAGFDILVTANNHSVDRGQKGIERTIAVLDTLSILHTGTFTEDISRMNDYPLFFNKNGISFSLLNYTFSTNGIPVPKPTIVNMIDTTQIRKDYYRFFSLGNRI